MTVTSTCCFGAGKQVVQVVPMSHVEADLRGSLQVVGHDLDNNKILLLEAPSTSSPSSSSSFSSSSLSSSSSSSSFSSSPPSPSFQGLRQDPDRFDSNKHTLQQSQRRQQQQQQQQQQQPQKQRQQAPHGECAESTRVSTPTDDRDVEKQEEGEEGQGDGAKQHHRKPATYMGLDIYDPNRPRLAWKQRLHHFTWAWWTLIMSTGGLSLLIYAQPFQFPGLRQMGIAVYILTVVLFLAVFCALVARFFLFPGDLRASVCHAREGFFLPTFFLSIATLITSTYRYAVPANDAALNCAIQVAFWLYLAVTLLLAVGQYSYVFRTHSLRVRAMMPTWILPIFPVMLSGTIASVIAATQPDAMSIAMVYAGLACQGLGISVSFLMYAHMIGRLMQAGLPCREHRPGLFMNVGPPAFTCLALIGMANGLPDRVEFFGGGGGGGGAVVDIPTVRALAVLAGLFMWGLSLWWFGIAAVAVAVARPRYFHLGWWASVFPNVGFTLGTISLARAIGSDALLVLAACMSAAVVLTYAFVLFHHIRAVMVQDIMYPGRDEDVLE